VLHFEAGLEYHHFTGRDRDALTGSGITAEAGTAFLDLENTEVTKFYFLTAHQTFDDNVKGLLHDLFDIDLLDARHVSDSKYDIFLGHASLLQLKCAVNSEI
jgi:hypothetical protein